MGFTFECLPWPKTNASDNWKIIQPHSCSLLFFCDAILYFSLFSDYGIQRAVVLGDISKQLKHVWRCTVDDLRCLKSGIRRWKSGKRQKNKVPGSGIQKSEVLEYNKARSHGKNGESDWHLMINHPRLLRPGHLWRKGTIILDCFEVFFYFVPW